MNNTKINKENQSNALPTNNEVPVRQEIEIKCMSNITMKPISWLWEKRIALGKLTVLAGNPGLGKSQTTAYLASVISTGGNWAEMTEQAPQGDVLLISAEDDPADTIKPRLMAAGADINHCHVIEAVHIFSDKDESSQRSLNLRDDAERLELAIAALPNPKLVVIDPVSAYLGGTDSYKDADMRGLLAPISKMAEKLNVAVILVTHLNKSQQQEVIGRVMGSIGLVAAARSVFIIQKDQENPEKRYFLPVKNNIGNDSDGFSYQIEGVELPEGIETSRIVWNQEPVNAHNILNSESEKQPTAVNEAQKFLRDLLADGPMSANDIFAEAEGMGYSKSAIRRAARALDVSHKKLGMKKGWQWSLTNASPSLFTEPEGDEGGEDITSEKVTPSTSSENSGTDNRNWKESANSR